MRWRHRQWQSLRLMTYAQNLNLSVLFCLQDQQKELRQQEEMSSLVWICTSTQATTKAVVIDANQPGNILESFFVCNSHVLCIASVPGQQMNTCAHEVGSFILMSVGRAFVLHSVELHQSWGTECFLTCDYICLCSGARETDYPAGEEVAPNSETGPAGDGSSQPTSSSSTGCDAVLGGITVVGCEVEGAAAVPQTATSPGKDGETGQRC